MKHKAASADLIVFVGRRYFMLNGSLVASVDRPLAGGTAAVSYQHTDALGSPVAVTNASRVVTETSEYEPFGRVANRAVRDGVGYTGHAEDAATGLTYMQQRYYDPMLGILLSVDPITAYGGDPRHFNRYSYAYNNPYKFFDPDGRSGCTGTRIQSVCDRGGVAGLRVSDREWVGNKNEKAREDLSRVKSAVSGDWKGEIKDASVRLGWTAPDYGIGSGTLQVGLENGRLAVDLNVGCGKGS